MKIAIFGDSYGVSNLNKDYLHWSQHLAKNHDVTNFSVAGSSLYYQYTQFKNCKDQFDKIIFLVTIYGHIHVEKLETFQHITSQELVLKLLRTTHERNFNDEQIKTLEALDHYYSFLKTVEVDILFHTLLINDIMSNKNVLIVPTFHGYLDNYSEYALYDLHLIDIDYYKIDDSRLHYNDKRNGHLNVENNQILFEKFENWINTDYFKLDIADYKTSLYPKELYF